MSTACLLLLCPTELTRLGDSREHLSRLSPEFHKAGQKSAMVLEVSIPDVDKGGLVGGSVTYLVKIRNGASTNEVSKATNKP